jgi:hypothetical protein
MAASAAPPADRGVPRSRSALRPIAVEIWLKCSPFPSDARAPRRDCRRLPALSGRIGMPAHKDRRHRAAAVVTFRLTQPSLTSADRRLHRQPGRFARRPPARSCCQALPRPRTAPQRSHRQHDRKRAAVGAGGTMTLVAAGGVRSAGLGPRCRTPSAIPSMRPDGSEGVDGVMPQRPSSGRRISRASPATPLGVSGGPS